VWICSGNAYFACWRLLCLLTLTRLVYRCTHTLYTPKLSCFSLGSQKLLRDV
jgi:hypothetical protein